MADISRLTEALSPPPAPDFTLARGSSRSQRPSFSGLRLAYPCFVSVAEVLGLKGSPTGRIEPWLVTQRRPRRAVIDDVDEEILAIGVARMNLGVKAEAAPPDHDPPRIFRRYEPSGRGDHFSAALDAAIDCHARAAAR